MQQLLGPFTRVSGGFVTLLRMMALAIVLTVVVTVRLVMVTFLLAMAINLLAMVVILLVMVASLLLMAFVKPATAARGQMPYADVHGDGLRHGRSHEPNRPAARHLSFGCRSVIE